MDLSNQEAGGNVDDRRGNKGKLAAGGGVVALVIAAVAGYFGIDPRVAQQVAGNLAGGGQQQKGEAPKDGYKEFSAKLIGSTNEVWNAQFPKNFNRRYEEPGMVLFSREVDSEGCGVAPSAVGPFYCPRSRKVFLDPTFFDELEGKLGGSKAQFSQAYVIAHEAGHHVQNLLGYNTRVEEFKREGENSGIRLELQADYLAGVWAHHARNKLKIDDRDVAEALKTARSIGDNRIQEKMKGKSWPESFNHGKDTQRLKYFKQGFDTGDASKRALDHFFDPAIRPLDL